MRALVTGGCGFIGSNFVSLALALGWNIVVLDRMTYASSPLAFEEPEFCGRYEFVQGDIGDQPLVRSILDRHRPEAVLHLAAESSVDLSIYFPGDFVRTNILGTFRLLETCRSWVQSLSSVPRERFRFVHVSTDEVFGSLGPSGSFDENSPYAPRSPYSASKAASDHLVRAWFSTYGFPGIVTSACNNFGPRQFPEKLIPRLILRALEGKSLLLYGKGSNVREWLFVNDHCRALRAVMERGRPGETYAVGGGTERTNLEIALSVCRILDVLKPREDGLLYEETIVFVIDRPGHDLRYSLNFRKIKEELGWCPDESFESGLDKTIRWYLENQEWLHNAGERLISLERRESREDIFRNDKS